MPDEYGETIDGLLHEYERLIDELPYDGYVRYLADALERLTSDWSPSLEEPFLELARSTLAAFGDGSVPDRPIARSAYLAWKAMNAAIASGEIGGPAVRLGLLFMGFMQEMAGSLRRREIGQLLPPLLDEQAWQESGRGLQRYDGSVRPDLQVKGTQMLVREIAYLRVPAS
jgi:hypothetical protein